MRQYQKTSTGPRKHGILLFLSLVLVLLFGSCAERWSHVTDYQWRIRSILNHLGDQEDKEVIARASRSGGDSLEVYFESFWAACDPLPETPLNEYRNRLEARLTTAWDSLISPLLGAPDSRIIPYVLYGSPTQTQAFPQGRDEYIVSWIYRPTFDVPPSALKYPQMEDLDFTITFTRDRLGNHRIDRESTRIDPELPYLTELEISELTEILQDESADLNLRKAASWRLRLDPRPEALRAFLLAAGNIEEQTVRESIAAAIHPLTMDVDSATGNLVTVPAELDSSKWQVDAVYDRDMLARMRRILLRQKLYTSEADSLFLTRTLSEGYNPARELPEKVVTELREYSRGDSTILRNRGWLTQAESDSLYTGILGRARSLMDGENPLEAHTLLEPLLKNELSQNPEAWHLDALSLVTSTEPGGREQADDRIRKALRLDPGNLRYELTRIHILFRRTFDRYGDQALDRLLDETPTLADAYALKGRLRLEILWGIGWRAGGWGTPLGSSVIPHNQAAAEAMGFLNMALVLDPDNAFASWWLGTHYMLTGRWLDVIKVMTYLIEHEAHPAEAYMGRGLAYQNIGLAEEAFQDYQTGLKLLPPQVRLLADDPRWALPPSLGGITLQRIEQATRSTEQPDQPVRTTGKVESGDRVSTDTELFWRSRDPLLATEVNERLLEQYRRFAHVCWRFALPSLGLRGWETHRGRIYLRFGEPLTTSEIERQNRRIDAEIEGVPLAFSLDTSPRGAYELVKYEYWYYDGFKIPLMIGMISGNRTIPYPEAVEELVEIVPESPRVRGLREVLDMNALDLDVQWYHFEDADGNLQLYMQTQFPKPEVVSPGQENIESYTAGLTLLDSQWNRIAYQEMELPVWLLGDSGSFPLISPAITLPGGMMVEGEIYGALEMTPPGIGPAYASRDTMVISQGGSLRMSSLIAASVIDDLDRVEDLYPGTFLVRENKAIVPLSDGEYYRNDPVNFCFEVYGLQKDEFNATRYQMALEITALMEEAMPPPVIGALGRLLGIERREGSVRVSFERDGISSNVFENNRIVFPVGSETTRYRLTLEVTDQVSGESVSESIILQSYTLPY